MSDASNAARRNQVLGAIRDRLGRREGLTTVKAELATPARHLVPARAVQDKTRLAELFAEHLRAANAHVLHAASERDVPAVVAGYLRGHNLPLTLRAGTDTRIDAIAWSSEPALTLRRGRAEADDEVGLSHAVAGIAETGTLMLVSGPENPVTVTFLPETSIVLMRAADLVGPYEDAFEGLRARYGPGTMPRTVNLVSGPSRTADVGGRLVTGAHGPRRLCVVVVGTDDATVPSKG